MPTQLAETVGQILHEQLPNLFRLYLNPYVTQACYCFGRYVQTTWNVKDTHQTFLANCFDEALGGAIKLARYGASVAGRPSAGLVVDPGSRLGPFATARAAGGGQVEFIPGLVVIGADSEASIERRFGLVVLIPAEDGTLVSEKARQVIQRDQPTVVVCVTRASLEALRAGRSTRLDLAPDIVVFDESFVNHDVPFAAFTARHALFDHWNRPGKSTFHSTTYQPNTISSLHFLRCLAEADPEFHAESAPEFQQILEDPQHRAAQFQRLYSPSLANAIRQTGCATADVRAAGDFVIVNGRKIFDAVSGVACSVRGHNPGNYAREMEDLGALDCRSEVESRLRALTGLECVLPAVSGATAVENALKIGLVAQFPKRHVLALQAGFGGKTLLALTGTWNSGYKEHIDPLYAEVLYADPFAADATTRLEELLEKYPVAVVQIELIQAVGGVRRLPDQVIRFLDAGRQRWGYLLLVDEVQTGMHRTGPFTLSRQLGLSPDLLTLGKGTSDMMFPFSLLLTSAAVQEKLDAIGSELPASIREHYGYEFGYRTVLNVLRKADELGLAQRVAESGALFDQLLSRELASCQAVREVRVHGLLIGIELDTAGWPRRWFKKRLFWFYLYGMLRHTRYPVLVGFCQCEPNVLKITPALTVEPGEVRKVCQTIVDVLRRPFPLLLAAVLGGLLKPKGPRRLKHEHEHADRGAHEPVAH